MNTDHFTPKAALLWSTVSKFAQEDILKNVFCRNCRKAVEITDVSGLVANDILIVTGECKTCHGPVARLVETSRAVPPYN